MAFQRMCFRLASFVLAIVAIGASASAQVVINEIVKEERTAGSGQVDPDVREFIELYNAGPDAVDISNWTVGLIDLAFPIEAFRDAIPAGTSLASGGYYVIGGSGIPNADFTPAGTSGENLYRDAEANLIELRDPSNNLVDAIGYDMFRQPFGNVSPEQVGEIGRGFRGGLISTNAIAPNTVTSWGRYRDGIDTNRNGLDFGIIPATPGATNSLPLAATHAVPNVDALAPGSVLSDAYYASFVLPTVIDPTVASGVNPRAIPASPQGGNAIVAWDSTGGGNASYSKQLVNGFDLYAYVDTAPLGIAVDTEDEEWETTIYGIGSTDPFSTNPDPSGGIFATVDNLQNSSTGIGWVYQQYENFTDPSADFNRMMLVDFGQGGVPVGTPTGDWTVIETIDVDGMDADWYRLSLDYDPVSGDVTARLGDQTYNFTTDTDLAGTFYVGYREGITSQGSRFDKLNPAIFDLYVETGGLVGDYDGNGSVGPEDYTEWETTYGSTVAAGTGADGNGDGFIDAADYTVWRDNLSSPSTAVPEPTALLLLVTTWLGSGRRRR